MAPLEMLDTVVNLKPIARSRLTLVEPAYEAVQQLPIGQVGTIVEVYPGDSPRYLVEFSNLQGQEYAMAILQPSEILALHYELTLAS